MAQRITLLLAVSSVLAGCASAPDGNGGGIAAPTITDPADYSYLENGTENNTAHIHDYWNGRQTIPIVRETQHGRVGISTAGQTVAQFLPGGGVVVPQGTQFVNVTVSWTPRAEDMFSDPELWVRTAAENEVKHVKDLVSGTPVPIEARPDMADLPHQQLSSWVFEFKLSPPGDGRPLRFNGQVTLDADAIRGLPLEPFPAHPDQWRGRPEIQLLDARAEGILSTTDVNLCTGECIPRSFVFLDGDLVPRDYHVVVAELTVDAALPNTLGLAFHDAATREMTRLTPESEAGKTRIYKIKDATPDGAYAKQSLWDFALFAEGSPDDAFGGSYHLKARVERAAVSP